MGAYKKVEYIRKEKIQKVYREIAEKFFVMAFLREIPFEKLKKLVAFKSLDPEDESEWEDLYMHETLNHLKSLNSIRLTCHIDIEPEITDDTFTLGFAEWLRQVSYDIGDKWYYQEDNETYSSFEMLQIYRAILGVRKI